MAFDPDFKYEKYEEYYGDKVQVQKIIDDCKVCGTKLVFTHFSDFKNLMVQAKCLFWVDGLTIVFKTLCFNNQISMVPSMNV